MSLYITKWVKDRPDWNEGRERYVPYKDISYKSAMIFTFDLQNWLKVTTHPLLNSSVCVKFEPYRSNYKCSEQRIFAWTDMTLILDLQISYKVTAHPLTMNNL